MMKKRHMVVTAVLAGLSLAACQPQQADNNANSNATTNATATTTAKADPKAVEEVKEMLAKHDKALNEKNLDAVMATFSTDPKTVVLGTGQGERFVGPEQIRNAYTEIFKDYEANTLETLCDWKTGGVDDTGTLAWLAATCQAKDSMKGITREYVLNVSGAVKKENNRWHFVMLHMSNATAAGPPPAANTKAGS